MPQGSILGPLLFNIDLIDLFYECEESNIASYADDTTPYSCARDTQTVISELKSLVSFFTGASIIILKSIQENDIYFWVQKPRLMYLLVMFQLKPAQKTPYLKSWLAQNSVLTEHISSICSKPSKKLHALGRIATFISFKKCRTLMKAFIEFQFNYCGML